MDQNIGWDTLWRDNNPFIKILRWYPQKRNCPLYKIPIILKVKPSSTKGKSIKIGANPMNSIKEPHKIKDIP